MRNITKTGMVLMAWRLITRKSMLPIAVFVIIVFAAMTMTTLLVVIVRIITGIMKRLNTHKIQKKRRTNPRHYQFHMLWISSVIDLHFQTLLEPLGIVRARWRA